MCPPAQYYRTAAPLDHCRDDFINPERVSSSPATSRTRTHRKPRLGCFELAGHWFSLRWRCGMRSNSACFAGPLIRTFSQNGSGPKAVKLHRADGWIMQKGATSVRKSHRPEILPGDRGRIRAAFHVDSGSERAAEH